MSKNIIVEYLLNHKLEDKMCSVPAQSKPLLDAFVKAEEALSATLSDEQKALFRTYSDVGLDYRCEQIDHTFTEGFKAGVLFGLQIKQ